jgi:hypothetical protein
MYFHWQTYNQQNAARLPVLTVLRALGKVKKVRVVLFHSLNFQLVLDALGRMIRGRTCHKRNSLASEKIGLRLFHV